MKKYVYLGAGAGICCSTICSPLDVAKIRLQVQGSIGIKKYGSIHETIKIIVHEEGIKGCFKGF